MDVHEVIAKNVRGIRELRGISQERLAHLVGVDRTFVSKIERGQRNTTAETIARIAKGLDVAPHVLLAPNYLETQIGKMEVDLTVLAENAAQNPSLRSFIIGYQAEYMCKKELTRQLGIPMESMTKPDDHDRNNHGDIVINYRNKKHVIEVKCLQTKYVKKVGEDSWIGKYQCDGSDATDIVLSNGRTVHTVAVQYGYFDIVAVGLFSFGEQWRFAFVDANKLDCMTISRGRNAIPEEDRHYFIKTMQDITWPLRSPYVEKIAELL